MKIFYYILILVFSLQTSSYISQLASFSWSETVEKKQGHFSKILSFEEKTIVTFRPEASKIRLDIFFQDGNQSTQLVGFKGKFLELFKVGESVVIFSTLYNGITKKEELHSKVINNNSIIDKLVLEEALVGTLHSHFKVSVSPNFKQVFVLTEKPHKKGKKEAVVFTILDNELSVQRSFAYLMNAIYSQKRKVNVPIVNNEGEAFVLKRHREKNRSVYYVLTYNTLGNVISKEFKLNYKPIQDAQYLLDNEGNLIIGGTYSSPNSVRTEGVYIAKFDAANNQVFRKEYDFKKETMLAFTSEKALKKQGLGLSHFRTNRLIQQKENITLILEHRESVANSKTGINTDNREGLIIYSFDLKGNFSWNRSLKMNQSDVSEKGYWNSFICFNDTANNKISIVYNEVGYFDKKADNEFGEHTAVGARSIEIDNQGNDKKQAVKNVFDEASIDLVLSPIVNLQKGSKMLILAEPINKSVYVLGVVE